MISAGLERILQQSYNDARTRRYELISIEHLLLMLIEQSDDVREVLLNCGVDLDLLSEQLVSSMVDTMPVVPNNRMNETETEPSLGFQRVIQRAIMHAQSADKREVDPTDVLVSIMSEKESPAVYL
mgnify:FL=1